MDHLNHPHGQHHHENYRHVLASRVRPAVAVCRSRAEIVRVLRNQELRDKIGQMGIDVVTSTPEQLAEVVATDLEKWAKVIKTANIPKTN